MISCALSPWAKNISIGKLLEKQKGKYSTIDSTLKVCHKVMLPITSCECKRSISAIRWLNNYLRCTMGNKRLSNLSLMHVHYDKAIKDDEVVKLSC